MRGRDRNKGRTGKGREGVRIRRREEGGLEIKREGGREGGGVKRERGKVKEGILEG